MTFVMMIVGVLSLICAAGVVFSSRSIHSAMWLIGALFSVAVHFALLGADFIAALQVMIYAGAIMVLVVFVIMLLGLDKTVEDKSFPVSRLISGLLAAVFVGLISYGVGQHAVSGISDSVANGAAVSADPAEVGRLLITDFLFAFEITGVLLLAAVIGAVVLAHDKKRPLAPNRGLKAMHVEAGE